jgi:hypothetical protein
MPEPRHEHPAATAHLHGHGDRLAWTEAADRSAGEGVVVALLPPTRADRQPRYRLCVFRDGKQSPEEIVLPEGVVFPVPRWASEMEREERLHHHSGGTLPWNEQIPGE